MPVLAESATCQELELAFGRDAKFTSLLVRPPEVGGPIVCALLPRRSGRT